MPLRSLSWVQLGHSSTVRCHLFGPSLIPGQFLTPDREGTRDCRLVVQAVPFARELLLTAGYLRRLRFARGIQTKTAGCVDFCVPVGLGFPGALYLSLDKVGHEGMSRNSRTKLGHHKFNSPETSLCGNAATKSTRKALKSSPWERHLF